ncbi:MAG: hypothetical protein MK098_06525 [Marinovum sp.]|nr:hypothetical protein [Marinovum sp.]
MTMPFAQIRYRRGPTYEVVDDIGRRIIENLPNIDGIGRTHTISTDKVFSR